MVCQLYLQSNPDVSRSLEYNIKYMRPCVIQNVDKSLGASGVRVHIMGRCQQVQGPPKNLPRSTFLHSTFYIPYQGRARIQQKDFRHFSFYNYYTRENDLFIKLKLRETRFFFFEASVLSNILEYFNFFFLNTYQNSNILPQNVTQTNLKPGQMKNYFFNIIRLRHTIHIYTQYTMYSMISLP